MPEQVYLELGKKKVFAASLRWPGWGRFAKSEEGALEALATYTPRYAVVAAAAGQPFSATAPVFSVVERLAGTASTEFGVPDAKTSADQEPPTAAEATRLAALLAASWKLFDDAAATAPESLRKGPRGGGRDRDKMVHHVIESEAAYARRLGVKHRPPAFGDVEAIAALRADVLAAIHSRVEGAWPLRYAVRRFAWHVLDHLWELEDRIE
jgi:hypothetical protein